MSAHEIPRILIVEDDSIASMDVQSALERTGYKVAAACSTGEEAIELVASTRPDLVLMDVRLGGGMDGVEAAEQIRDGFDVPVVYLTVFSDERTLERAKSSGPFGYLLKPVDDRDLRSAIEVALYKHQMEWELKKAKQEAEAANEAKSSFLATISHELRTPMNGVLGMTELLLMSDLETEHKSNVQLIKDSAMSLLGVLNQILDYSKLEARIHRRSEGDFRFGDIFDGLINQYRKAASEKEIELKVIMGKDVPEWVVGDSAKLKQALGNVLDNAIKFTKSGLVLINCDLCTGSECYGMRPEKGRTRYLFSVTDTGCGIPADQLDTVFDSFTQVEDYMTRNQGGLGLGLAITRRLVTILGGNIWLESEENAGTTIHFTADLLPSELMQKAVEPEDDTDALVGLRIALAEDDVISQTYISRVLEKKGASVSVFADGSQLLEALSEDDYDLVLMDIQMPVLDGIRATKSIRDPNSNVKNAHIPIIALTAHAMWGDEQRCIHAGMDAYIAKPVDLEALENTIRITLKKSR